MSHEVKGWLRHVAAMLAVLLVGLLFLYVWPGPLRYSYYRYGMIRVDKITGQQQFNSTSHGWQTRAQRAASAAAPAPTATYDATSESDDEEQ